MPCRPRGSPACRSVAQPLLLGTRESSAWRWVLRGGGGSSSCLLWQDSELEGEKSLEEAQQSDVKGLSGMGGMGWGIWSMHL